MSIEIYVTDDEPRFLAIIGKALEATGHPFNLCKNSDELMDALRVSSAPAIIFLDIHMDGQDGIETINRLHLIDRPIRLRFVTGGDIPTAVAAGLIAVGQDIDVGRTLFKPFPMDQFIRAVADDVLAFQVEETG